MASILKIEVFEFEKNPFYEGKISYIKWVHADYDLEAGVKGSLTRIYELPGVKKIEEESRHYYSNSKYQWYVLNETLYRYNQSGGFKAAIIKSGQDSWTIFLTILDPDYAYIADDILESIKSNE